MRASPWPACCALGPTVRLLRGRGVVPFDLTCTKGAERASGSPTSSLPLCGQLWGSGGQLRGFLAANPTKSSVSRNVFRQGGLWLCLHPVRKDECLLGSRKSWLVCTELCSYRLGGGSYWLNYPVTRSSSDVNRTWSLFSSPWLTGLLTPRPLLLFSSHVILAGPPPWEA